MEFDCGSPIGKGPLGITYHATECGSGREVACKLVPCVDEPTGQMREIIEESIFFRPEVHPRLAGCILTRFDQSTGSYLVVTEYYPQTLHDLILEHQKNHEPFSEDAIWQVIAYLADATSFLHSRIPKEACDCNFNTITVHSLIHGNIKPSNVMITKSGSLRLADNRVRQPAISYREKCGDMTLHCYRAPEMYDRDGTWTEAVDTWSIGCIAYHMACLRPPFLFAMLDQVLSAQKKGTFAPIPETYSQKLRTLISRMLSTIPSYRPTTAELCILPEVSPLIPYSPSRSPRPGRRGCPLR